MYFASAYRCLFIYFRPFLVRFLIRPLPKDPPHPIYFNLYVHHFVYIFILFLTLNIQKWHFIFVHRHFSVISGPFWHFFTNIHCNPQNTPFCLLKSLETVNLWSKLEVNKTFGCWVWQFVLLMSIQNWRSERYMEREN